MNDGDASKTSSIRRRLGLSAAASISIALLWLLIRSWADRCYLYFHRPSAVFVTTAILGTWLFFFFAGNKVIKVTLIALTLLTFAITAPIESNFASSAASLAARTLQDTARKLESAQSSNHTYPLPLVSILMASS